MKCLQKLGHSIVHSNVVTDFSRGSFELINLEKLVCALLYVLLFVLIKCWSKFVIILFWIHCNYGNMVYGMHALQESIVNIVTLAILVTLATANCVMVSISN